MNRQERRRIKAGEVIFAHTIRNMAGQWFWYRSDGKEFNGQLPPGVELHGPFRTEDEVKKDQQLVLFGAGCKITEGGMWDPAWDRLQ